MSKTIELARRLERLHINNMYKSDFYWTWDKTDEELEAIFTVADALRDLRERNQSTRPTWFPSWRTSSASETICSSVRVTNIRKPLWMPWMKATVTAFWSSGPRW